MGRPNLHMYQEELVVRAEHRSQTTRGHGHRNYEPFRVRHHTANGSCRHVSADKHNEGMGTWYSPLHHPTDGRPTLSYLQICY